MSWLMFQMGGLGPMQGQVGHTCLLLQATSCGACILSTMATTIVTKRRMQVMPATSSIRFLGDIATSCTLPLQACNSGPCLQANHFVRYAPEQIEYAKNRYVNETNRLYQVHNAPRAGGPVKGERGKEELSMPCLRYRATLTASRECCSGSTCTSSSCLAAPPA